jgi:hypothetical protein
MFLILEAVCPVCKAFFKHFLDMLHVEKKKKNVACDFE